jgi:hypothetical protein
MRFLAWGSLSRASEDAAPGIIPKVQAPLSTPEIGIAPVNLHMAVLMAEVDSALHEPKFYPLQAVWFLFLG